MIIKSAIRLVFAAGCLTAIMTLPTAHAQMGAPGGYGYGPRQVLMAMVLRQAPLATALHQAPIAMVPREALMAMALHKEPIPHQAPIAGRQAPMERRQAPTRRPSMSRRRPQQARPESS